MTAKLNKKIPMLYKIIMLIVVISIIGLTFISTVPNPLSKATETPIEYVDIITYVPLWENSTIWINSTVWQNSTAWENSTIWLNSTEYLPYPFGEGWNDTDSTNLSMVYRRSMAQTPYRIEWYNIITNSIYYSSYNSYVGIKVLIYNMYDIGHMTLQQHDCLLIQLEIHEQTH